MIMDNVFNLDDFLADFSAKESLSALDQAILLHATDGWPMGRLAQHFGTTPTALHRRKRELFAGLREYLKGRGITCSTDALA
jgi:hypothetical protein